MSREMDTALRRLRQDLAPYLDEAAVRDTCRQLGHRRRRDARLTPHATILRFVAQVLNGNTALTHVTLKARRAFTESAYCQARPGKRGHSTSTARPQKSRMSPFPPLTKK